MVATLEAKLYRIGLNNGCPVHQVRVAGQCFPRDSERVEGYGAETQRSKEAGALVLLQPGQEEKIRAEAKHKVIRSTKNGKTARIYDDRTRNYSKMPGDTGVGGWLYIKTVETDPHAPPSFPSLDDTEPAPKTTPAPAGSPDPTPRVGTPEPDVKAEAPKATAKPKSTRKRKPRKPSATDK